MPRQRRGGGELAVSAEINVTALVDVALTLLVTFMITAPMLQGGVEVSVPRARTESVPSSEGVTVSIDRSGAIYIGEAETRWEEFERVFPILVKQKGAESIYLRADSGVPYGRVVQVLGAMKGADVGTVGLIAEPLNEGR